MAEWNVYYDSFFFADLQKPKTQNSGVEVSINKTFLWGAEEWKVLSMYLFDKGPVFHLCKRIKDETIREFYAKWGYLMQMAKEDRHDEVSFAEWEMMRSDSPYGETPSIHITIDGSPVESGHSMSDAWIPLCYDNPEPCENMPHILSHYSLEDSDGWLIIHLEGEWPEDFASVEDISQIEVSLEAEDVDISGPHFSIKENETEIKFIRPLTGQQHTLKILSSEPASIDNDEEDRPWHNTQLTYTLEPDLSEDIFSVRDCSYGEIGGVGIILDRGEEDDAVHTAFSSLYFNQPEEIEWRIVFHEKIKEDLTLTLQAGRDFGIMNT